MLRIPCVGLGTRELLCPVVSLTILFVYIALSRQLALAQEDAQFTVAEDIGVSTFDDQPQFSPDGHYFFVKSDRGRVDLNRAESSIRLYRFVDMADWLSRATAKGGDLVPLYSLTKSTYKYGPIISNVRWLPDSSGLVFLVRTPSGNQELFLVEMRTGKIVSLTPENQYVTGFSVRSGKRYAYTVLSPSIQKSFADQDHADLIPGTGRSFYDLSFPAALASPDRGWVDLSELWVVDGQRRFRVEESGSGRPMPIHSQGQRALAIGPSGHEIVTALIVRDVPTEWETLYPPRYLSHPDRIRGGRFNAAPFMGRDFVSEYVLVNYVSGKSRSLTNAPMGSNTGWNLTEASADWSPDGQFIVLSNSFLPKLQLSSSDQSKPCVVVADVATNNKTCLQPVAQLIDPGNKYSWRFVSSVRFSTDFKNPTIVIRSAASAAGFVHQADGSWKAAPTPESSHDQSTMVCIKEGLNDPPVLIAADKRTNTSRVIWDPNPRLKKIKLAPVSVFRWVDKSQRGWIGGLFMPPDYVPGKRYPLVIQNHGFEEDKFRPSGSFTTSFAAQELAAEGFVVLQVKDCPIRSSPEEAPCQVAGYEAAVEKLTSEGIVDPDHLGIIGFSRTCYYVLEAITNSSLHFRAALIADGVNYGYMQYMLGLNVIGRGPSLGEISEIGDQPFGNGLNIWLKRSPLFRMDRVTTPLEVVAASTVNLPLMWEPYAALRHLQKPVDLVLLNSEEHVFTNPRQRLLSQGITVDWFRFWLEGYRDTDPTKQEQYKRWDSLRAESSSPDSR